MASVDLARRAEIGREKRARTRERLISAATALLSRSQSVSVDEIVAAAGVAKGTFYVHFEDVDTLWTELADRFAHDLDELLQPRRLALTDPLRRVAYGCAAFLETSRRDRTWGAMAARAALRRPDFAAAARARLLEDIAAVPAAGLAPEIAAEMVAGVILRVGPTLAGRAQDVVEATVAAILRALGVSAAHAARLAKDASTAAREDIDAQKPIASTPTI
jgi:AcrR family transcriptional regulator